VVRIHDRPSRAAELRGNSLRSLVTFVMDAAGARMVHTPVLPSFREMPAL
jgi:hypothetical protein